MKDVNTERPGGYEVYVAKMYILYSTSVVAEGIASFSNSKADGGLKDSTVCVKKNHGPTFLSQQNLVCDPCVKLKNKWFFYHLKPLCHVLTSSYTQ